LIRTDQKTSTSQISLVAQQTQAIVAEQNIQSGHVASINQQTMNIATAQRAQTNEIESILQHTQNLVLREQLSSAATGVIQAMVQDIKVMSSNMQLHDEGLTALVRESRSKLDETDTEVRRIHDNTKRTLISNEDIRRTTERIESTQQALVNALSKNFTDDQSISMKILKKELNRTISRSLRRHLMDHFQSSVMPPSTQAPASVHAQRPAVQPVQHQSHERNYIRQTPPFQNRLHRTWTKYSCRKSYQELSRSRWLGRVYISTTTVTYLRQGKDNDIDTKEDSTTVVSFFPPAWLSSTGVVMGRQNELAKSAAWQSKPRWSLKTVNILPYDAEIFKACRDLDLDKIRNLFDQGLASPYDVNPAGRNLVGRVAVGVGQYSKNNGYSSLQAWLENLHEVFEYLLEFGVDTGEEDTHSL
jgi:hypothetical protein